MKKHIKNLKKKLKNYNPKLKEECGVASAHTTYGICGIKVWIFLGEIMEHNPFAKEEKTPSQENTNFKQNN